MKPHLDYLSDIVLEGDLIDWNALGHPERPGRTPLEDEQQDAPVLTSTGIGSVNNVLTDV